MAKCEHADWKTGYGNGGSFPRLPLQYGSAQVDICADCGMWRRHEPRESWRQASELLIAYARRDEE